LVSQFNQLRIPAQTTPGMVFAAKNTPFSAKVFFALTGFKGYIARQQFF
jgi:hypothetical protein